MPLSAGEKLGVYEILSPLGAGGIGEVYRARDFLHFAIFLFVACSAILALASLSAPPSSHRQLAGFTYPSRLAPRDRASSRERRTDGALSVILVILVGLVWLYFTG